MNQNPLTTPPRLPILTRILLGVVAVQAFLLLTLAFLRADLGEELSQLSREMLENLGGAATPTVTAGAALSAGEPWIVATIDTEIYSGPALEYSRQGSLSAGQVARIQAASADGQWWLIVIPGQDPDRGWVMATAVNAIGAENVPVATSFPLELLKPTPLTTPEGAKAVLEAITNVNIRSGPGLAFRSVGLLKKGETAEIIGRDFDGYWWAISMPELPSGQGWVARDYVIARRTVDVPVLEAKPGSGVIIISTPGVGAPTLTAVTRLNVRSAPDENASVLTQLDPQQRAEIVGVSANGAWWAIKLEGAPEGLGWVAARFVTVENATGVPVINQ